MQIGGKEVAEAVANGAAISAWRHQRIIPIKGASLAGPFPLALQGYTVYAAAIRRRAPTHCRTRLYRRAGLARHGAALDRGGV